MMSAILGKTLEQTISLIRGNNPLQNDPEICLEKLQQYILSIDFEGTRSRENCAAIAKCIELIKDKAQSANLTTLDRRLCLLIIAHLASLQEDIVSITSFVLKCIEDTSVPLDKSIGYMVLTLMNQCSKSSVYLAVNTILKDICNRNPSIACIALTATTFLIDMDLIPVFLPSIEKQLKNANSNVKCKSLCVLHRMFQIAPEYIVSLRDRVLEALCDRDPNVMSGCLPLLVSLVSSDRHAKMSEDVHIKVIFILKQVEQGRLPIDMMYRGVSGPWIQIRLIRIIRSVARDQFTVSNLSELEGIFISIFARFQTANSVQHAIVVECILTIISFHPQLEKVHSIMMDTIEKFLNSKKINILVIGVEMLKALVSIKPGYSKRYADTLLSSLSFGDQTLTCLILQFITDFTCSENSTSIINRMFEKLSSIRNPRIKREILSALFTVLKKYPMTDQWMLKNYIGLLEILEDTMESAFVKKLLISLQSVSLNSLHQEAKRLSHNLSHHFHPSQYCIVLEVIGLYCEKFTLTEANSALKHILENCHNPKWPSEVLEVIILTSLNTVLLLAAKHNITMSEIDISDRLNSSAVVQQKYAETKALLEDLEFMRKMIPISFQDVTSTEIDPELSFLDDYTAAHTNSATTGDLVEDSHGSVEPSHESKSHDPAQKLKFKPYSKSRFEKQRTSNEDEVSNMKNVFLGGSNSLTPKKVKKVWNLGGYELAKLNGEKDNVEAVKCDRTSD